MKLLKQLFEIYSPSHHEEAMIDFLTQYLTAIPGCVVEQDSFGNVYATKGISETYPCVVAHTDQVQHYHPEDFRAVETDEIIFGYSANDRSFAGLGADDKCGIWIALKCMELHPAMKAAFFTGEEVGCQGSSRADMDFFSNVRFVVQPDRRGCGDLITSIGCVELCSREFIEAISPDQYGYEETDGLMTDVEQLKENGLNVSCINLSCGYYDPHTDNEYVVKADLLNCLRMVDHIIQVVTDPSIHEDNQYGVDKYDWYGYDDDLYDVYYDLINAVMTENPLASFDEVNQYAKDYYEEVDKPMLEEVYQDWNKFHNTSKLLYDFDF